MMQQKLSIFVENDMSRIVFSFFIALPLLIGFGCSEKIDNTGTCSDGIRNQGEFGIDCGGPCDEVCPSCADGILNQGETGIDCGGPCSPCFPELKARIDENPWNSTSRNASLSGPGELRIFGTDQLTSVTLVYLGDFMPGITNAGPLFLSLIHI